MKFLHTSDWHIGKSLRNQKRDDEYRAVLAEVLEIARREEVDCLLLAGDIYDSAMPSPEAERIVFDFFRELVGVRIPAVVIGGNHDHPRRLNAIGRILELVDIHVRADTVRPEEGGLIEVPSRDRDERAVVAMLPWVSEGKAREWASLTQGAEQPFHDYAEEVAQRIEALASVFPRSGTINILLAHVFTDGSVVTPGGGERELHLGQIYAVNPARFPTKTAHYVALGHVHRPQQIRSEPVYYSGSLLQLDFGEAGQTKCVNIVEAHPGRPARVRALPLTSIRNLRNLGSAKEGLTLEHLKGLADEVGDDYLKVWLKVDRPLPGLAAQVRDILPNAVDIVVERSEREVERHTDLQRLTPAQMFAAYYRGLHENDPLEPLMALFGRLHQEATDEAA
jgi:exonuclease SbcD